MKKNNKYIYIPKKNINLVVTHENEITVIKHCSQDFINMLIHQNEGELIEFCYGSLLDNCLYACKKGYMSITESYLNEWSSDYLVLFSRSDSVYNNFYTVYEEEIKEYSNEL